MTFFINKQLYTFEIDRSDVNNKILAFKPYNLDPITTFKPL